MKIQKTPNLMKNKAPEAHIRKSQLNNLPNNMVQELNQYLTTASRGILS